MEAIKAISPKEDLVAELEDYRFKWEDEEPLVDRFRKFLLQAEAPFSRSGKLGHVTGSAFIINAEGRLVLFVHHAKLGLWLQPGGHCEEGEGAIETARREAREETGLADLRLLYRGIFDLDIHAIPARGDLPEHYHYDVRYLFGAESFEVAVSEESYAVEWLPLDEAERRNPESSVKRPLAKLRGWSRKDQLPLF